MLTKSVEPRPKACNRERVVLTGSSLASSSLESVTSDVLASQPLECTMILVSHSHRSCRKRTLPQTQHVSYELTTVYSKIGYIHMQASCHICTCRIASFHGTVDLPDRIAMEQHSTLSHTYILLSARIHATKQ